MLHLTIVRESNCFFLWSLEGYGCRACTYVNSLVVDIARKSINPKNTSKAWETNRTF